MFRKCFLFFADRFISTLIAVAAMEPQAVHVFNALANVQDGTATGLSGTLSIPANGQKAIFLNQIDGFGVLPIME